MYKIYKDRTNTKKEGILSKERPLFIDKIVGYTVTQACLR